MTHMSIKHEGSRQQLVRLLDAELNAVTFVRDYMQLHFDGSTLDAFTMPTVIVDDSSSRSKMSATEMRSVRGSERR
jgi:hypothetical protein